MAEAFQPPFFQRDLRRLESLRYFQRGLRRQDASATFQRGLRRQDASATLLYYEGDDHAGEDEEDAAYGVGDGVAHGRDGAVKIVLDGSEGCDGVAASRYASQGDGGMKPEYLDRYECGKYEGNGGAHYTHQEEFGSDGLETGEECGSGAQAHDGDKEIQPDIVHEPYHGARYAPESGALVALPP